MFTVVRGSLELIVKRQKHFSNGDCLYRSIVCYYYVLENTYYKTYNSLKVSIIYTSINKKRANVNVSKNFGPRLWSQQNEFDLR